MPRRPPVDPPAGPGRDDETRRRRIEAEGVDRLVRKDPGRLDEAVGGDRRRSRRFPRGPERPRPAGPAGWRWRSRRCPAALPRPTGRASAWASGWPRGGGTANPRRRRASPRPPPTSRRRRPLPSGRPRSPTTSGRAKSWSVRFPPSFPNATRIPRSDDPGVDRSVRAHRERTDVHVVDVVEELDFSGGRPPVDPPLVSRPDVERAVLREGERPDRRLARRAPRRSGARGVLRPRVDAVEAPVRRRGADDRPVRRDGDRGQVRLRRGERERHLAGGIGDEEAPGSAAGRDVDAARGVARRRRRRRRRRRPPARRGVPAAGRA